ncbi:MAG TPA: GTP pyrophosphokinase, partial [Dysgonamonadaceae bacterium]|nr:GTP pyrophosphokinase [Dysgonamonadaceae bacterium]
KEDLYYLIGNNDITLPDNPNVFYKVKEGAPKSENLFVRYVKQAMNAMKKAPSEPKIAINVPKTAADGISSPTPVIDTKSVYVLKEEEFKKNFIAAPCCKPIPGDKVFGFINDKNEVEVHKRSCETGMRLKSNFGDRIVEVEWGDYRQYSFLASIAFTGIDRLGILSDILSKLSEEVVVNIQRVNVSSNDGIFEGVINVYVHSVEDVNLLCSKIAKVDGVSTVHRLLV